MKKTIACFFLFCLTLFRSFAQSYVCQCSHSTDPYYSVSLSYATANDTGCAYPSAGTAVLEVVVDGNTLITTHMSSQDAADICQLNLIFEVFVPLISPLIPAAELGELIDEVFFNIEPPTGGAGSGSGGDMSILQDGSEDYYNWLDNNWYDPEGDVIIQTIEP